MVPTLIVLFRLIVPAEPRSAEVIVTPVILLNCASLESAGVKVYVYVVDDELARAVPVNFRVMAGYRVTPESGSESVPPLVTSELLLEVSVVPSYDSDACNTRLNPAEGVFPGENTMIREPFRYVIVENDGFDTVIGISEGGRAYVVLVPVSVTGILTGENTAAFVIDAFRSCEVVLENV